MNSRPPQLHLFFNALTFYTRLPAPGWVEYSPENQARCTLYLPLIGLLIGLISAAVFWLCSQLFPISLAVLLSIATSLLITGALHEDGLADSCDGFGGGWDKAQILSIMKDSRIGTYGVLALTLALLIKFSTLLSLAEISATMIFAHGLSRVFPLLLIYRYDYVSASETSKAKAVVLRPSKTELLYAAAPVFIVALLLPASFISAFIPGLCVTLGLGAYFYRRIGGYTGDCLGACQQLTELSIYLWLCLPVFL